jgi:hypothetical protein
VRANVRECDQLYLSVLHAKESSKNIQVHKVDKPDEWLQNTSSAPIIFAQPEKDQKWAFTSGEKQAILEIINKQPQTLGDITRKIFVGLQTSADKIYVLKIKKWKEKTVIGYSNNLKREIEIEIGLIKPFLMGRDVKRYEYPNLSILLFSHTFLKTGRQL